MNRGPDIPGNETTMIDTQQVQKRAGMNPQGRQDMYSQPVIPLLVLLGLSSQHIIWIVAFVPQDNGVGN